MDSWEEQTRRFLSDAQSELKEVEEQIGVMQKRKTELTEEVNALSIALRSYLKRMGKQETSEVDLKEALERMENHRDRLLAIAERSDGLIRVGPASDVLYNLGFIKSKRRSNAYRIVQNMLSGMAEEGILEKVDRATYRLVPGKRINQ